MAVGKRELFGNVITRYIKSLITYIWDRATAAWCNASELELNIGPTVHRLAEGNKIKIKTNEER